ncbi:hypothetical protein F2Q69_00030734 [Brassica cretica]|uniref:Uncharacterized protein n=1 Tax=Brassica cretica TaxID=69181 RepID=A0A8S9SAJ8_BRACR|nr:hypothetical protein F2Q69_00030734 [Brassica cretica]
MGGRLRWLTQNRSRVSLSSSLVISVCLVVVGRSGELPSGLYAFYLNLGRRSTLSLGHRCRNKVVMCGEQLKVIVEKKLVVKVRLKKGTVMDVCFIMDCYRGFVKVVRGHRERVVQMRVPAPYEEVFCLVCSLAYFIARSASHMIA